MIWASHITVASTVGYVGGYNLAAINLGAVLPDLVERLYPKAQHRGLSHSLVIHFCVLLAVYALPLPGRTVLLRDVWLGVLVGHLLCDSLTVSGIPALDQNGMRIVLFGGKIRTGTVSELFFTAIFTLVSFLLIAYLFNYSSPFASASTDGLPPRRDYKELYRDGVIDKREYHERKWSVL